MTDTPVARTAEVDLCPKHKVRRDVESHCHVCHGDGETEDLDDYSGNAPMVTCWSCKGTGRGFMDCEFCLEEEADEI
jgi:DnaJ-class molecular chaperone